MSQYEILYILVANEKRNCMKMVVETFTVVVVVGVVVVVSVERHDMVMVMGWWLVWKL